MMMIDLVWFPTIGAIRARDTSPTQQCFRHVVLDASARRIGSAGRKMIYPFFPLPCWQLCVSISTQILRMLPSIWTPSTAGFAERGEAVAPRSNCGSSLHCSSNVSIITDVTFARTCPSSSCLVSSWHSPWPAP